MSSKIPEISVVMPVYNGELYLKEAIDSILNQTYTNFEFIIINDGSTDATESIISAYNDERIVYFKQANSGIGNSLRKGCEIARGKYIARMDADDVSLSYRFSKQINYLEKNQCVVLVSSAAKYINEEGTEDGRSFPYTSHRAIIKKMKLSSPICHPAVMFRKETYDLSGGYMNVQPFEDLLLWFLFSKYGKLHNLATPLLKYRILKTSVSHSMHPSDKNKLFQFLRNNNNNNIVNENYVQEYMRLYNEIKSQLPNNIEVEIENSKKRNPASNLEVFFYQWLTNLKIPDFISEKVICTLKRCILIISVLIYDTY